ncbi:LuxR family transcriptional regulator, partial [Streptomyces endophyticus]|nr:LuxR family transcriptional regulator [Streptomyces endophyticus]
PHGERCTALAHAARLAEDPAVRAERLVAAADHARLAGRPHRARELLDQVGDLAGRDAVRGRAALVRGLLALRDGPVADARESLLLAARLCVAPASLEARLGAAEASWALGDAAGYREAVEHGGGARPADSALDYRVGMAASLGERAGVGRVALRRVVARSAGEREPGVLLRAEAAALVAGDVDAA